MPFLFSIFRLRSWMPGVSNFFCRPIARWVALALLALGLVTHARAAERPRLQPFFVRATPTPEPKLSKLPHLLAVGVIALDVQPVAGPRVRRPPLLPIPKRVEPEPTPAPVTKPPAEPAKPEAPAPSDFSPNAPHTLLPMEKKTSAPVVKEAPTENTLVTGPHTEPDLKDAVIYFDTPVGPRDSRATIPLSVPLSAPATTALPESRANLHKEKE